MTRSVLLAGLLGGLLGGAAGFAANRYIVPLRPATPPASPSEARAVADGFVSKLKAAKYDEFVNDVKLARSALTEEEFAALKKELTESRQLYPAMYGQPTGEFELLRETALSPSLVRVVYLEKFERGGVLWSFTLYQGKDRWWLAGVVCDAKLPLAFGGLS